MKDEAKRVEEAGQATDNEICDMALRHYEQISQETHCWNNLIPKAIEVYRSYLAVLKDPKVPEVMIKDGGGGICGECDVESYNSCRSQFIPLLIVKDREIAELKERATEAETRAKWYDTLVKTKLMGSKFSNLRQYVESLEAENAELRKEAK